MLIFDAKFEFTIFSRFWILDDEEVRLTKNSNSKTNHQKVTKSIDFTTISVRNHSKCMLIDTNFEIYYFFERDVITGNKLVVHKCLRATRISIMAIST